MAKIITIPQGSIIYDIDIEIHKPVERPTVYTKQYDSNTRFIVAKVYNDGEQYILTTSDTIHFACTKPDGFGIDNECGVDNEGRIVYKITDQTSAKDGQFPAEFRIYSTYDDTQGNTVQQLKTTANLKMWVDKSTLNNNTIISSDEANVLTALITDATAAINDATTATTNAINATNNMNQLSTNVSDAENVRVTNENTRISNENQRVSADETRPLYFYLTQAEYDALPQADKDNPKNIYEITDDDGILPNQLQQLITDAQAATDAANQAAAGVLPDFGTVGIYNKVITDVKGRVQSGTLETTLDGLGVTNAYTKTEVDGKIGNLTSLPTDIKTDLVSSIVEMDTKKLSTNGDSSNNTVAFSEATLDEDIISGDTHATLFSKIKKRLANILLNLANKFDKANIANNLSTTAEGLALDARQGKVLNDSIGEINNNFNKLYITNNVYDFKIINGYTNIDNIVDNYFSNASVECVGYIGGVWINGYELLIGYEYKTKMYGYQLKLSFTGTMQYRFKNNTETWGQWQTK